MAHMGRRTEVSPPRDSATRSQRSGYVLLAVSGVVLATAFGGLASIIAPGDSPKVAVPGGTNSTSGAQLIPGDAAPGQTPVTVDGVAIPAGSRTAVVTTNPDGTQVVTLLPAEGSNEAPIVLPPGTPLPPGTVIPPGTTLPPGTTTTPPRNDIPATRTTPNPTSSSTPTSTPDTTSPTTDPTTPTSNTAPPSTPTDDSSTSSGSDSSNPTT
ncbi:hypothetical protein GCM10017786_54760 [Amycolatopsis deserti]|uniref:Uncharacterized protein n=1 Tax=Amycolatopsis deserti TaxID=185696 RepID=A0ABQ3JD82_9PSEU|nr:hypothetical protein [Amycolatopsis deserti]GHF14119.1 hypothetical protein GCM10017786_54760 [Amycolatopsis deserti]